MNRGVQWKSGINNRPSAYVLINELVAKKHTDTDASETESYIYRIHIQQTSVNN